MTGANEVRAAGRHILIFLTTGHEAVSVSQIGPNIIPRHIEFFSNQLSNRGHAALAHFSMGATNSHNALGVNRQPSIDFCAFASGLPQFGKNIGSFN